MSLAVAIPFGVAAAIAFGSATAVQHAAVQRSAGSRSADVRGLVHLVRDPRWLLSIAGDAVGVILQVVALATGPVVVVQPLFVLAVPVSLPVRYLLGGPRPRASDLAAGLTIIGALAVFLVLAGTPGSARIPTAPAVLSTVGAALIVGAALGLVVRRARRGVRAGVYGGVAGAWFGVAGVLVNSAATMVARHDPGWLVRHGAGQAALGGLVTLAVLGMALTQVAFQIGSLAASFPASEAAGPLVAVGLGAVLLHEHVATDAVRVGAYAACLALIVLGTVRLAGPPPQDEPA